MIIDLVGWLGATFILYAYFLVSSKKVAGNAVSYQLLNLAGAVFLMINTYFKGAIPSTVLNIIWAAIAVKILLLSRK